MSGRFADPMAADKASRQLAQSEFDHPVIVVAGAGTGKTALLVARVAAWCMGTGWERHLEQDVDAHTVARRVIEGVVAITFTEAAAAEMAHKIGKAFLDLSSGDKPVGWDPEPGGVPDDEDEIRRRARALSEEGHRLVVSTIHAFCQRLLATYPLEAGLHPRFEVDPEGGRIQALAEEIVEEALRDLDNNPNRDHWERLASEGVGPAAMVEALCALVEEGVEPELFSRNPFDDRAAAILAERLLDSLNRFAGLVGDRLDSVSGSVSMTTRDDVAELGRRMAEIGPTPSMNDLEAVAQMVGESTVERLKKWSRLTFTKGERSCFGEAAYEAAAAAGEIAAMLEPLLDPHREELAAAREVMAPLLEEVQRRQNAAGLVTFSDLLRRAEGLLAGSPGVRREVVAGIDHLLVDEFQDTDEVQCRLVERLALTGDAACRPSLFIVGDPKQSIYAWRSADLAAYDAFVENVTESGGVTVDLVRNFRSVTAILDEVERLVAPVMREETGIQPRFQKLEATDERRNVPGVDRQGWRTVEHWLTWPRGKDGVGREKGSSDRATSELEAVALASDVRRLHEQGVIERWGDVAVLLRVTTGQEVLLQALREAGVPYEVAREREYYRQREIVEMAALVRSILEPTDALALLTVLRSDVVGVPDAALAPLWDAGFPRLMARLPGSDARALEVLAECIETARAAMPVNIPGGDALPGWPHALRAAAAIIAALRASLVEDPPDVFVEKIRTMWLAEVTAAARFLGGFRRARVDRFLADLEDTLVSDEGGNADLARFLRVAVEEGREGRMPPPPDLESDAVHVMTIHRAKGLDFEHVYVAQIHKQPRSGAAGGRAAVRRIERRREYQLFSWPTPGFAAAEWVQRRKTQAEMVRLLYVATTRAKKRLVISGGWGEPGEEVPPESAPDFGRLIGRRLDPEGVARQIREGAAQAEDESPHVMRVMPVFGARFATGNADRGKRSGWVLPEERLERAGELAAARLGAAERMAREVFRTASAEAHHRLRRDGAEGDEWATEPPADRGLARALGTAVHRMLEKLDLDRTLAPQVAEHRTAIVEEVASDRFGEEGSARTDELLARIAGGGCLQRLEAVAAQIVARELPVLLWSAEETPGAVVSGLIDLVYRDPDDGRLVVADYKTDQVRGDEAIEERREVYAPQVRTYARALREALALDHEPHAELWFLDADRIVRL